MYYRVMQKTRHQKSHATVPLIDNRNAQEPGAMKGPKVTMVFDGLAENSCRALATLTL